MIGRQPLQLRYHNQQSYSIICLQVFFDDAFGEPDGTHSIKGVWSCSHATYKKSKSFCYIFLSILCGGPCAFCWGIVFACQSLYHIWILGPMLRCFNMDLKWCKSIYTKCVECCVGPCNGSCAGILSQIPGLMS